MILRSLCFSIPREKVRDYFGGRHCIGPEIGSLYGSLGDE